MPARTTDHPVYSEPCGPSCGCDAKLAKLCGCAAHVLHHSQCACALVYPKLIDTLLLLRWKRALMKVTWGSPTSKAHTGNHTQHIHSTKLSCAYIQDSTGAIWWHIQHSCILVCLYQLYFGGISSTRCPAFCAHGLVLFQLRLPSFCVVFHRDPPLS